MEQKTLAQSLAQELFVLVDTIGTYEPLGHNVLTADTDKHFKNPVW